jgi:drug/metabolite transporter superfamily protein YnfA
MSRGLALALPALVVVSCFLPLAGLLLGTAPSWLAAGIVIVAAIGICSTLLRDQGIGRAIALSVFGVTAGTAVFLAFAWGLNALGSSQNPAVNDLANTIVTLIPLVLMVFALAGLVVEFRALPSDRILLGVAWATALVVPFALSVPIAALSDQAGNAGMDVIALFVMPFAALLAWVFILVGVLASPEGADRRLEVPDGGSPRGA